MRALIYTRQSTDKQDTTQASQAHDCQAWATSNGYEVAGIYHDVISGATPVSERPAFQAMLADIQEGDTIISKRRDRLGRDVYNNAEAEQILKGLGARFTTPTGIDSSTPSGRLHNVIEDGVSSYDREILRLRTKAALAQLRREGKPSGTPLLGTKIVYHTAIKKGELVKVGELAENTDERAKIDLVRSWRAEGLTFEQLRARCEDNNITTRRGMTPSLRALHKWCEGVTKPKVKRTTKTGPVKARRIEAKAENKGLKALAESLRAQGFSYQKVAKMVTEEGYKTSKGGPITKTQIMRILSR